MFSEMKSIENDSSSSIGALNSYESMTNRV